MDDDQKEQLVQFIANATKEELAVYAKMVDGPYGSMKFVACLKNELESFK